MLWYLHWSLVVCWIHLQNQFSHIDAHTWNWLIQRNLIFSLWSNNSINCAESSRDYKIQHHKIQRSAETLNWFRHIRNYQAENFFLQLQIIETSITPSCIKLQKDLKAVLTDYITWCKFRIKAVKCTVKSMRFSRSHWNK